MAKSTTPSRIKTRGWAMIAVSVFITAGCGSNEDTAQIEAVKEAVRDTLKDPNSAEFTNVRVVEGVVCGEVNAKNSFGGYAGKQRFWGGNPEVTLGQEVVVSDEPETPCDLLDRAMSEAN